MADAGTLAFYDREGATYADWSAPKEAWPWLEKFLAMAPAGPLLDYGCGGGWAAARMLAAGREVSAFDGSAGLAAEAAKRTGLDVKKMRFEAFAETARYAGIWASFCLLHAPRAEMPGNLARIRGALLPGGLFYLGLKRGAGEARDKLDRFYVYYEAEEIAGLLAAAGFEAPDIRERASEGYDGAAEHALHIYAFAPAA